VSLDYLSLYLSFFSKRYIISIQSIQHPFFSKVFQEVVVLDGLPFSTNPTIQTIHSTQGLKSPYGAVHTKCMSILIFDTETSGLIDRRFEAEDPEQPDVVQLAALLCGDDGEVLSTVSCLVRPDLKAIQPGAAKVHGITQAKANAHGLEAPAVLSAFGAMVDRADVLVAHNLAFDALVLRTAWHRAFGADFRERLYGKRAFCTMKAMTPVCKILSGRSKHKTDYKWPKLSECIDFLFAERLEGAHDALVDARACSRIYFELQRRKGLADNQEG
jgi:DNA polymerase-3 subunit epsilon